MDAAQIVAVAGYPLLLGGAVMALRKQFPVGFDRHRGGALIVAQCFFWAAIGFVIGHITAKNLPAASEPRSMAGAVAFTAFAIWTAIIAISALDKDAR